jgi:hypothetical protein
MSESERIDRGAFLKRAGGLLAVTLLDRGGMVSRVVERTGRMSGHPDPRPGINADHVLKASDLEGVANQKDVNASYAAARGHPEVFDGLACACGCSDKGGEHRSLLVCYETKQPTGCVSCREVAKFVGKLANEHKTLDEIRSAFDKKFG